MRKFCVAFQVSPCDGLEELEAKIRQISKDGATWGASELRHVAYGLYSFTILCTITDTVNSDELLETINSFEDSVYRVEIASFTEI